MLRKLDFALLFAGAARSGLVLRTLALGCWNTDNLLALTIGRLSLLFLLTSMLAFRLWVDSVSVYT